MGQFGHSRPPPEHGSIAAVIGSERHPLLIMRLSRPHAEQIRQIAEAIFGSEVKVRLFGSRIDDAVKGGDVDLFVESPSPVARPAYQAAQLAARASRLLHGRKVDVVVMAPNLLVTPIHRIAQETGIPL